jgi:tRNA(Ile)-lysidine synthase
MLRQLGSNRAGARTAIRHDGAVLRVYKGRLRITAPERTAAFVAVPWRGETRLQLDALGGALRFRRARGGIDPAAIPRGGLMVDLRRGGERLQADAKRPHRTLKNLFQEAGIPEWERRRLPLLFRGESLVWVPRLGVDAAYRAPAGKRGWLPEWRPD